MKIKNIRHGILIADLLWVPSALGFGIALRYAGTTNGIDRPRHLIFRHTLRWRSLPSSVWTLLYSEMNLDGFKGGWHLPAILSKLIVAVSLLMVVLLSFAFLTQHYYSRLVLLYFAILFLIGLAAVRCLVRFLVTSQLRNAADDRCVILGNGPIAQELASKIISHPEAPFQIVGFLFPSEADTSTGSPSRPSHRLPLSRRCRS